MQLDGIASRVTNDVDDFRATRELAEAALADVLADEPAYAELLSVVELEPPEHKEPSLN